MAQMGLNVDGWEDERTEESDRSAAAWGKIRNLVLWEDSFMTFLTLAVWVQVYVVLVWTQWSAVTLLAFSLISITFFCSLVSAFNLLAPSAESPQFQKRLVDSVALKVSPKALEAASISASLLVLKLWDSIRPMILCDDRRRTLVFLTAVFGVGLLGTLVSTLSLVFVAGLVALTVPKLISLGFVPSPLDLSTRRHSASAALLSQFFQNRS